MKYYFDEDIFRKNFNAKEPSGESGSKSVDSYRLNHAPDNCFKLYPYKATTKNASPIVYDLSETISSFFRTALGRKPEKLSFENLCEKIKPEIDIEEDDWEFFQDILYSMFFKEDCFRAKNIGMYSYQIDSDNKSAEKLAYFLHNVLGLDNSDREYIKKAEQEYPFNVVEKMLVDTIKINETEDEEYSNRYYTVVRCIQNNFKDDFKFMLSSEMTSIEDISNLLSIYYFYYVSQVCLTLDQFGIGDRNTVNKLYYALDWEKVSKNRLCCTDGWDKLQVNIQRMFSHAITLEILNQNDIEMLDYIDLKSLADEDECIDEQISSEIKRAEAIYVSYIGDCKKFDTVKEQSGANKTDSAIRHLFDCVDLQFRETDRKRASQFYCEKFSEFCKSRFVKNRTRSGLVLNLNERDIIFLTKLALRDSDKIRLNELYTEYEKRGIYIDNTSKMLLQDFFTKLNLIDKKSDSGDAQYVKRIL